MREKIHPQYMDCTVRCSCGNTWTTRATVPSMTLDLCNKCHPFYTGTQKLVDTGGRVQRFADKFGSAAQAQLEREAANKAARAQKAAAADAKRREAHEAKAAEKAKRAKDFAAKQEAEKRKAADAAKAAAEKAELENVGSTETAEAPKAIADVEVVAAPGEEVVEVVETETPAE